ncbi:beta-galactosidase GalB [uncultured Bacteroides sp.]|uniref:beta-galactosidase GalB n=1 Tax=uncultured Bacteroides sp. TaxID=162156 RepID=UPI002AAB4FED|nr:beta-galactosidase GalB [uncultured Bacteroides sp.]
MRKLLFLALGWCCSLCILSAQVRTAFLLEKGWKFTRTDNPQSYSPDFNDSKWQSVVIPHDWAIYGPFSSKNDMQKVAITQDGQKEAMEHAGRTGGLPFVGVGWYRINFKVPEFTKGKKAAILFDGAMSNPEVFLNGKKVGHWAYGYNSFYLDITPYLNEAGNNLLAVRLENKEESSRWYPGAGLYRNVHVIITDDAHIPVWGTQLTTPKITSDFAKINLKTKVVCPADTKVENFRLVTEIKDADNKIVATNETNLSKYDGDLFEQNIIVTQPKLWDIETPYLYKAVSKLYEGATLKDEYTTTFGIRSIEIIPDKGFFLNGKKIKFRGVCMHHDLGPLGAATNEAALRHQVSMLKEMGSNAIRTSHNMPSPELIKVCDEMGMMVMAESFDEWKAPKCKNGYNLLFDEWAEKDLVNLVHHYRNNPSVVMWSIGNEVPQQGVVGGAKIARFLQDICHREDPTRPVTQGMNKPKADLGNNFAAIMDIAGINYHTSIYPEAYEKLPQQLILGCETASTVSSRGVYKFPVEPKMMQKYDDHQSSSYDVEYCDWSNLPEDDYIQHDDRSYCIGEFVWTGFDYLGEPTPYYENWPNHSSLFGIIDLASLPKDRYYLYRSHWNPTKETLHILPHWNWKGREGEVTPVFVYTNYPSAELFINGKSQGIRTKDLSVTVDNSGDDASMKELKRQKRYRLMWMDTKYEPGTVKVVAYDKDGKAVAEKEIRTAGAPHHIELTADRTSLTANGKDLSYITVKVVDKDGNLCPDVNQLVKFKVSGAGTYRAGANGDPISLDLFHLPQMTLFNGMLTAIVQTTDKAGNITLKASAKGLKTGVINLQSK